MSNHEIYVHVPSGVSVKTLWFSWEDHRRSRELAVEFEAEYRPLTTKIKWRTLKYPFLITWTVFELIRCKPGVVFCQNPSVVLASLLCFLKPLFKYKLFVDRHSNFKFETQRLSDIKWRVFHFLSKFSVRNADLTIVTNKYLADLCTVWSGNAVVLQDKIPDLVVKDLGCVSRVMVSTRPQVMFVTMFDDDEPIREIISACESVQGITFYFSGNFKKVIDKNTADYLAKKNIFFMGFLPEDHYISLMARCDAVCVLTIKEYILNCGAYEAVSLNKPLILSNTKTIRSFFSRGVVYVNPLDSESIRAGILNVVNAKDQLQKEVIEFKESERAEWTIRAGAVKARIRKILLD